ncbi:SpoIIE family protein phosphatase [Aeromicrobium chenweiae]|uniref:Histidine kinase n=1 Tax=Aeromicrobium chenweiae TaxID=2079793 RepID=A0A2S0WQ86_9ACTN|nr:SpoIIE family protein phosphatase [Aeromicrobium chenweiae]AWB93487.1 histidine kinase [Aeromicrobium chenweiae]TGN34480.1 GAF domain-containing protein [Aeromicrobium chenweiae]
MTTDSANPFAGLRGDTGARDDLVRQLTAAAGDQTALAQVAALAARLLDTPSAHVSLISDVQTIVGGVGASLDDVGVETPADGAVCAVTAGGGVPMMVFDALDDDRLRDLAAVRAGNLRSYLGVPLVVRDQPVGVLCVYGPGPREWSDQDLQLLEQLGTSAVTELQLAVLSDEHEDERLVWQLAVDAAGVGAFDWSIGTGEVRWDDRIRELFGLGDEVFGADVESFHQLVHPDDSARVADALTTAVETCGTYAAEYRVVLPDGVVRWVTARGRALAGPHGAAVRLLGAAYDTTAVQEGEARVARLLEAMPMAFFQLDPQWRFTFLNSEAHRLLGGIGSPIVGDVIWDLFPDAVDSDFEAHYRGAVETGEPVEFEAYYPPPLDRWYEVRGWPAPDGLAVYFVDVTERRRAQERAESAAERARLLSSITDVLTGTLDEELAVAHLAEVVVGPWADWSAVTLIDYSTPHVSAGTGSAEGRDVWRRGLRDVAGWHADPAYRPLVDRYLELRIPSLSDDSFLAQAVRDNRPVFVDQDAARAISAVLEPGEAREVFQRLDPTSTLVLPLRGRERTIGLLTVFRGAGSIGFTGADIADLVDVASRAGVALDNVRLYAEQRDLAEGLQRSLMTAPPEPDHLHVSVRYEPSAEVAQVGGDWYDAFLQTDGATNIVIGDVVGHDTAAAAAMGQVRGLLRGIAVTTGAGPAEVLQRVDEAVQTLQIETMATAVVARLEQTPEERDAGVTRLRWSNAGHPPPLIAVHPEAPETPETTDRVTSVDPRDVTVTALWPDRADLLLGLVPETSRTESVLELSRGCTVLLYTDGLVERRGQSLDDGVAQLQAVLAELIAAGLDQDELCDQLLARMLPEQPEDDVALVAVRLHPQDRPRPAAAGPESVPDNVVEQACSVPAPHTHADDDPRTSLRLPFDATSAGVARRRLVDELEGLGFGESFVIDAELVLGELAANGLEHGRPSGDDTLDVSWCIADDVLRISVCDGGKSAELQALELTRAGVRGRGLAIVDQLCDAWTVDDQQGLRVTAELRRPLD